MVLDDVAHTSGASILWLMEELQREGSSRLLPIMTAAAAAIVLAGAQDDAPGFVCNHRGHPDVCVMADPKLRNCTEYFGSSGVNDLGDWIVIDAEPGLEMGSQSIETVMGRLRATPSLAPRCWTL